MMRLVAMTLAMAVLAAGGLAMAQTDPTSTEAPAAEQATATVDEVVVGDEIDQLPEETSAGQKIICRTANVLGSRLRNARQRVCGTRDSWEHMQDEITRDMYKQGAGQRQKGR